MDFFGVGSGEILLVLIVALLLWGPGRLVEIARTLGKTMRAFRKATSDLTSTVAKELDLENQQKARLSPPPPKGNTTPPPSQETGKQP